MAKSGVIFDFGGVFTAGLRPKLPLLEARYGLSRADVIDFFRGPRAIETVLGGSPFTTEDMARIMVERLTGRLGEDAHGAAQLMCGVFLDRSARTDEMFELAEDLHAAGLRLGLLSNGPADSEFGDLAQILETGWISDNVISGRDGVGKPSAEAFDLILKKLGMSKPDVCFIDDQPFQAEAAEALGITSFVYKGDAPQLREQLRAEGIEV